MEIINNNIVFNNKYKINIKYGCGCYMCFDYYYVESKTKYCHALPTNVKMYKINEIINRYLSCKIYDNMKRSKSDIYLYNILGRDMTNIILSYMSSIKYHNLDFGEKMLNTTKKSSFYVRNPLSLII